MKRKEPKSARIAEALDMPLDAMCDFPRIEFMGNASVSVENFRGILDYNEHCVKVNTTVGIVEITGEDIFIESITDEEIMVKGRLEAMRFV